MEANLLLLAVHHERQICVSRIQKHASCIRVRADCHFRHADEHFAIQKALYSFFGGLRVSEDTLHVVVA